MRFREKTSRSVRQFPLGGTKIGVIAGPCAVETPDQIMQTALAVKAAGGIGLRGGAFKPRTSPYSYQGLGAKGLELLAEARQKTGLAVVTEVIGLEVLDQVVETADVIQIGARNMQHFPLLEAVGKTNKPVLLKRGMSATLDEFLLAAEYIINAGNPNVILCERGIRTFETYVRNTLPLSIIPALRQRTHLPIVIDPSHGTGHAYMVPSMCWPPRAGPTGDYRVTPIPNAPPPTGQSIPRANGIDARLRKENGRRSRPVRRRQFF